MNEEQEERFDVVIYEVATDKIDTIIGHNMPLDSGSFHTARKREAAGWTRINDRYAIAVVPHGIYTTGAVINLGDVV